MNAMNGSFTGRKRIRKNFGRIPDVAPMPNLIDVQRASYEAFLQMHVAPDRRTHSGLQEVFKSVFPIDDFAGRGRLEFVSYEFEEPKYDVEECMQRGMTYAAPLKVILRLIVWDVDEDTGARSIRDIKEQPVYMGDMPLMTDNGTFIVNGTERVIVSQMHRSPGVFFDHDKGKTHASGKFLFAARIIPYRGSWLDFEFDAKDLIYVRIDRKRKLPVTTLLYALDSKATEELRAARAAEGKSVDPAEITGMDAEEILNYFYDQIVYTRTPKGWARPFDPQSFKGVKLLEPLVDAETGAVVAEADTKLTARAARKIAETTREVLTGRADLIGRYVAEDLVNYQTGEIYAEAGEEITEAKLTLLEEAGIERLPTLAIDQQKGPWLRNTLVVDKNSNREDALIDIYRVMRPGEPPTLETAEALFRGLFFDPERYDLSAVGRVKMNMRLGMETDDSVRVLRKEDILRTVKTLCDLKDGRGNIDDIDNLGNRRVRSVGELMENQYRIGLLRMERAIRERMSSVDIDSVMPHDLINAKPAAAAVREFFGSSQLSQFMDQTNPLSEVTHKRRLSALGPGGLTRERAGFEVRDVHPTHYGRICPIETPEGPNIGLIASLSTFARVNEFGFVETPYRRVAEGKITDDVSWYSALEEEGKYIAQASALVDERGKFRESLVSARLNGDFHMVTPDMIQLMDVSPNQMVSVAAALVPFLEHDDANRALMGANMQRQAVPLIRSHAPFVGTGMEGKLARDSGVCTLAKRDGTIESVDATRIVVRPDSDKPEIPDIYPLMKFQRSNQSTCYNQTPIVRAGDRVKAGDVLADGPSTDMGELALGQNVLVAFMPWQGFNFEDSILVSERIAKEDVYTSIHIEEFECIARDTKLGKEEITRDIPNVGEEALKDLDESGIVRIGAEVKAGDILVGKITPKGETQLSPEEKLLRAIFGEKAGDVRDSSLRVPPGVQGIVIKAQVFSRKGAKLDKATLDEIPVRWYHEIQVVEGGGKVEEQLEQLAQRHEDDVHAIESLYRDKIAKLTKGDELPPGVIKMVKVYVAIKRKLSVGDKMAGRHGNKGVVSRVLPEEDMPYMEDGTPVDVVLNPLGVPSRMNVGQILEVHLGWAARQLGAQIDAVLHTQYEAKALRDRLKKIYTTEQAHQFIDALDDDDVYRFADKLRRGVHMATPVFDGAKEDEIKTALTMGALPTTGQTTLFDGKSGQPFDHEVTVGIMYIMKLHHLVDDKIHARSIGPYSLVTQQPLGGKAQFGGQRLGEMEVWAMEAYGAAYGLQEFLTVKSDDVVGRTRMYEAIVKGEHVLESGLPESFNVLLKELQSLCLNVELIEDPNAPRQEQTTTVQQMAREVAAKIGA